MRNTIKRWSLLLCVCVLLMGSVPVSLADGLTQTEAYFSQPEEYSGMVEVPGRGLMRYYAQNDPLWASLIYERYDSTLWRPFRDSGCCPTAAAMAVALLVPEERLSEVAAHAKQEYSLCPCSLNKAKCYNHHERYVLTTERDFVRFLPLVFGDFALGNNIYNACSRAEFIAGTSPAYLYCVAPIYGLKLTMVSSYTEALNALEAGYGVVATAGGGGAFTNTGHYVFLAHADAERVYIMDPLARSEYKTNNGKKIEIIQPGLVSMTHDNVRYASFTSFLIFSPETP